MDSYSQSHKKISCSDLPLSLEKISLLYLVGHLDQYTSDTLALLPTLLKQRLLSQLPAVDLHRLEKGVTTVTGIDLSMYWKALLEFQDRVLYRSSIAQKDFLYGVFTQFTITEDNCGIRCVGRDQDRDIFLDRIASHIIPVREGDNEKRWSRFLKETVDYSVPHANMVCVPQQYPLPENNSIVETHLKLLFQECGLNYLHTSSGLVYPTRMKSLLQASREKELKFVGMVSLMKLLVDYFDYRAPLLPLSSACDQFYQSEEHSNPIEQFLSQVTTVALPIRGGWKYTSDVPNTLKRLIEINFLSSTSRVRNLEISAYWSEETFVSLMTLLTPYLSKSPSSPPGWTPYRGLQTIKIRGIQDKVEGKAMQITDSPIQQLASIIHHQDRLSIVSIDGEFAATPQCNELMTVLAGLITKQSAIEVRINGLRSSQLSLEIFLHLVLSYLLSSTSEKQSLVVSKVALVGTSNYHKKIQRSTGAPIEGLNLKALTLGQVELSVLAPPLSVLSPTTIGRIELCSTFSQERKSNLPNLTAHSVTLAVDKIHGKCPTTVDETAKGLILNSDIKELRVMCYDYSKGISNSYFSSLGDILGEHARVFRSINSVTVRTLNDDQAELREPEEKHVGSDKCPIKHCGGEYKFWSSLVELAQAVPFDVKLELMQNHAQRLYCVWKQRKPPTKKFSKLILFDYPHHENELALLKEIAECVGPGPVHDMAQMTIFAYGYLV